MLGHAALRIRVDYVMICVLFIITRLLLLAINVAYLFERAEAASRNLPTPRNKQNKNVERRDFCLF